MKKRIQFILITICVVLIYCIGPGLFKPIESCDARTSERADQIDALEWGFKFASAIPIQPHIDDRSKSQYQILKVYLEKDMPDELVERVGDIADWRECLSYADLAVHYAQKAGIEKAQDYLRQARQCRDKITGWQKSWQRDRIAMRMVEAQVMAGQWSHAKKTKGQLPPEFDGRVQALRLSRLGGSHDYETSIAQLQSMENSEHLEVKRDVALAYISILKQLGSNTTEEQCLTLQTRIYSIADKLPQLLQHDILCSLSRAAFSASRQDMGHAVLEYAENQLRKRELKARYDVGTLTELAVIWAQDSRDSKHAESLLQEAKELLIESSLKGTEKVTAMTSLTQGYAIHGNQDEAWKNLRLAIQTAETQKNARPRAMAFTEICATIGNLGITFPDDVYKGLTLAYAALGDPW